MKNEAEILPRIFNIPAPEYSRLINGEPMPHVIERMEPDRDGNASVLIAYLFTTAPVRSKRYYFVQDSQLDRSIITRIELFGNPVIFTPTIKINDTIFNVVNLTDLAAGMFTIKNQERELNIQNMPLNNFFKQPYVNAFLFTGALTLNDTQRGYRELNTSILSGESWLQFSSALTTPLPIAFLFNICYTEK